MLRFFSSCSYRVWHFHFKPWEPLMSLAFLNQTWEHLLSLAFSFQTWGTLSSLAFSNQTWGTLSILAPVGLAEKLCFFSHVLLNLSPVDVAKKRADVARAEN